MAETVTTKESAWSDREKYLFALLHPPADMLKERLPLPLQSDSMSYC